MNIVILPMELICHMCESVVVPKEKILRIIQTYLIKYNVACQNYAHVFINDVYESVAQILSSLVDSFRDLQIL